MVTIRKASFFQGLMALALGAVTGVVTVTVTGAIGQTAQASEFSASGSHLRITPAGYVNIQSAEIRVPRAAFEQRLTNAPLELQVETLPGGLGLQVWGSSGQSLSNLTSADSMGTQVTNQILDLSATQPISGFLEQQSGLAPALRERRADQAGLLGLE